MGVSTSIASSICRTGPSTCTPRRSSRSSAGTRPPRTTTARAAARARNELAAFEERYRIDDQTGWMVDRASADRPQSGPRENPDPIADHDAEGRATLHKEGIVTSPPKGRRRWHSGRPEGAQEGRRRPAPPLRPPGLPHRARRGARRQVPPHLHRTGVPALQLAQGHRRKTPQGRSPSKCSTTRWTPSGTSCFGSRALDRLCAKRGWSTCIVVPFLVKGDCTPPFSARKRVLQYRIVVPLLVKGDYSLLKGDYSPFTKHAFWTVPMPQTAPKARRSTMIHGGGGGGDHHHLKKHDFP